MTVIRNRVQNIPGSKDLPPLRLHTHLYHEYQSPQIRDKCVPLIQQHVITFRRVRS